MTFSVLKNVCILLLLFLLISTAEASERIVYTRLTNEYWQIWTIDLQGSQKKQITISSMDKRDPTWINNGSQIAFRTPNGELYIVDADGKNETRMLKDYGILTDPDISADGKEIVFVRFEPRPGDISDIWKSNMDTQRPIILTKDRLSKYQPKFSSDGKKIAYVSANTNRSYYHIWIMNSDGSAPQQLSKENGFATHPEISPDHQWVTFSSNRNKGVFDIYKINIETGQEIRLTDHKGLDVHSSFSPQGKEIVYVSDKSGSQQLWIMDSNGNNHRQITFDKEDALDPEWGKIDERDQ